MRRLQQSRQVLGSVGLITLVTADDAPAEDIFESLWRKIDKFEKRFSRFLPDSELTRFNQAAGRVTKISRAFHDLLLTAQTMSSRTAGLYNPFVLPALQRAGYEGSWPQPQQGDPRTNYKTRQVVSTDRIEIWPAKARIPPGTALDFGGIGKGYLLDQLAEFMDAQPVAGYWLSLGGDILCSGFDVDGQPWQIGISQARVEQQVVATLTNPQGARLAVATSGVTRRQGIVGGKHWHHLIDPRTNQPAATDILTATVCVRQAISADVYAKCLVIVGSQFVKDFIDSHRIPQAILQFAEAGNEEKVNVLELTAES